VAGVNTKTVVFIPGAWMTPESWDGMRGVFDKAGYKTHAPAWPLLDGATAAALREKPPMGLGSLSVGRIVEHYQAYIAKLPEKPLIVGHSFGGLFTQLLLDQGVGVAGIAIDPAPIAGVIPGPVSLAAAFPVLARVGGWSRPFTLSRAAFASSFANTAPPDIQKSAYDKLVVPTSGLIFYQAASWIGTFVHPRKRAQPLLITVGEKDRTVTPYVARAAYNKQKHSPAKTDFKLFPGMSHFLIAEPGWEKVANFALDWAKAL
jgi:pimeloyl-ACP methyl ester carboxylesterase